jgi:hypothetical protein
MSEGTYGRKIAKPTPDEEQTHRVLTLAANVASKRKLQDIWKERETAE